MCRRQSSDADSFSRCSSDSSDVSTHNPYSPLGYVVLVQFKFGRTGEFFHNEPSFMGAYVIVQADRGEDCGVVVSSRYRTSADTNKRILNILRYASSEEQYRWTVVQTEEEKKACKTAQELVSGRNIPMKVVHAEFQFDMKKLTLHFTSKDAHPRFREVLDECFAAWKCRIWFARYSRVASDTHCRMLVKPAASTAPTSVASSVTSSPRPVLVIPAALSRQSTPPPTPVSVISSRISPPMTPSLSGLDITMSI
eukprot:TRINITY_DN903_c0_g1_i1.p1 TRINITY_DN903_c0_g1~~TRINITY_DN903_c0_g1_i1.p1  ORF type:complete len:253 (+),score=39.30 TRINITY_DN903_c0_g1_i1:89-847(+)